MCVGGAGEQDVAIKPLIEWTEALEIGHVAIDADHRRLVGIINRLHEAIVSGQSHETIEAILVTLTENALHHFEREEQLMRRARCAGLDKHRQSHAEHFTHLAELIHRFELGEDGVMPDTLRLLVNWVNNHVKVEDQALIEVLRR